ncbi:hypothetical protein PG999_004483 [Apiospora kogelbergensis]|uniref:Ankyrin repeat-containing protein n=1 Tax=Apiospora kogelbergensis TaxID=1337665 RepID=A0AAW0QZH0_9PEZI
MGPFLFRVEVDIGRDYPTQVAFHSHDLTARADETFRALPHYLNADAGLDATAMPGMQCSIEQAMPDHADTTKALRVAALLEQNLPYELSSCYWELSNLGDPKLRKPSSVVEMKGDTKASAPAPASRTQTISYVDLMKPDEDWRNLPDASERRKIQNRLAQRAYSMLTFPLPTGQPSPLLTSFCAKDLKKLREEEEEGEETPALAQEDEEVSSSNSGSSTPSVKGDATTQMDELKPSTIATSEWLGRYFPAWPDNTDAERALCVDMSPVGDGLAHLSDAACYPDYQLSPDYLQQTIAPRPMLSKTPDVLPDHSALASQQHPMQNSRAMNEAIFYPKAAYQMPSWPSHAQRNVAFETMGDQMASEQARRITLPSPLTSLGQLNMASSASQATQHQRNPSKLMVGRLLNTEHNVPIMNGGKVNEAVPGGILSPISDLSEQVWQRVKLSSPFPSLVPRRPSPRAQHRQQQQQQQQQHNAPQSAYTQQLTSPEITPIAEATNSQPSRCASSSSSIRRPPSPEKSPVLEKKQKQKKGEVSNCKSSSATPNNNNNNTNAVDHPTTAASPPPTSLLHLAVAGGHIDTLRLLLQRLDPAAFNARDERGYTALEFAVMEGRTDLVALLLEHSAGLSR